VICPLIEQLVTLAQLIDVREGSSSLDGSATIAHVKPPSILERTSPGMPGRP
jgi:hypothetical protein